MSRKSISFSKANEAYMTQVVKAGEYNSKSEFVNELVSLRRRRDAARKELIAVLDEAVASGVSDRSPRQILDEAMSRHGQTG